MQNPNEDTEWNDVLRAKGILAPKEKEVDEEDIIKMMEKTIVDKAKDKKDLDEMNLDELDELEDEEEERMLLEMRKARMAEIKSTSQYLS